MPCLFGGYPPLIHGIDLGRMLLCQLFAQGKERQGIIEAQLKEIEGLISHAEVIDPSKLGGDVVKFGATVMVVDEETDEESTYQIVGSHEADAKNGSISVTAPLARALIGKTLGEVVEVRTPGGSKSYEIIKVEFK